MGCGVSRIDLEERSGKSHLLSHQNSDAEVGKTAPNNATKSISSPATNIPAIVTKRSSDGKGGDGDDGDDEGRKISKDDLVGSPSFREYCVNNESEVNGNNGDGDGTMPAHADKASLPRKRTCALSLNHRKVYMHVHNHHIYLWS